MTAPVRLRLRVRGAVQGVGFRPFVFRTARELGLRGWVVNDARGVTLEAEGPRARLERLLERVQDEPPPHAVVHAVEAAWLDAAGYHQFEIRRSDAQGDRQVFVLPDLATCGDCRLEIASSEDRRYGYPFTNCTACGPRFSILRALPYDRPHTTMAGFSMCTRCAAEYATPEDRRFHAQPNACPACGPRIWLAQPDGTRLAEEGAALQAAGDALRGGSILALKGLGGFQLLVDATNQRAVQRLRQRKQRWEKPLALMVRSVQEAATLCDVPEAAAELLEAPEAPIVLLQRREPTPIAESVAPENRRLGLMLPYTPLHHRLLAEVEFPVVATSGNRSDEPLCIDNDEALDRLRTIADVFLLHDRPIERHVDDSVAVLVSGRVQLHRRARGYAPLPVTSLIELPGVLAVGPHLKNTVALGVGHAVFVSQHVGDLSTPEARTAHRRVIEDLVRLYAVRPTVIAHDLHPDYASTQLARQLASSSWLGAGSPSEPSTKLVAVQHHHAHLAACLADNGVAGPALGVTWDGMGLGPDGTAWGGELLYGDAGGYVRLAHLRPFRLPGGDQAALEPRRSALGVLHALGGTQLLASVRSPALGAFERNELSVLQRMLDRQVNCPVTTSAGRLFDAVASLAGLRQRASFEGQAALELEQIADPGCDEWYPIPIVGRAGRLSELGATPRPLQLDWGPMVEHVLRDVTRGLSTDRIAARFHHGLTRAIADVARATHATRVALTGGCFHNELLTAFATQELSLAGIEVLVHRQVPPGDGGVSLGQAMVAAAQLRPASVTGAREVELV